MADSMSVNAKAIRKAALLAVAPLCVGGGWVWMSEVRCW